MAIPKKDPEDTISLDEARERFHEYYNSRSATKIGRLRAKVGDIRYRKTKKKTLVPDTPGSARYLLPEGPRSYDMLGVDTFSDDEIKEDEKGNKYVEYDDPDYGMQRVKLIEKPRMKNGESYKKHFKKVYKKRREEGDLSDCGEEEGEPCHLVDKYWKEHYEPAKKNDLRLPRPRKIVMKFTDHLGKVRKSDFRMGRNLLLITMGEENFYIDGKKQVYDQYLDQIAMPDGLEDELVRQDYMDSRGQWNVDIMKWEVYYRHKYNPKRHYRLSMDSMTVFDEVKLKPLGDWNQFLKNHRGATKTVGLKPTEMIPYRIVKPLGEAPELLRESGHLTSDDFEEVAVESGELTTEKRIEHLGFYRKRVSGDDYYIHRETNIAVSVENIEEVGDSLEDHYMVLEHIREPEYHKYISGQYVRAEKRIVPIVEESESEDEEAEESEEESLEEPEESLEEEEPVESEESESEEELTEEPESKESEEESLEEESLEEAELVESEPEEGEPTEEEEVKSVLDLGEEEESKLEGSLQEFVEEEPVLETEEAEVESESEEEKGEEEEVEAEESEESEIESEEESDVESEEEAELELEGKVEESESEEDEEETKKEEDEDDFFKPIWSEEKEQEFIQNIKKAEQYKKAMRVVNKKEKSEDMVSISNIYGEMESDDERESEPSEEKESEESDVEDIDMEEVVEEPEIEEEGSEEVVEEEQLEIKGPEGEFEEAEEVSEEEGEVAEEEPELEKSIEGTLEGTLEEAEEVEESEEESEKEEEEVESEVESKESEEELDEEVGSDVESESEEELESDVESEEEQEEKKKSKSKSESPAPITLLSAKKSPAVTQMNTDVVTPLYEIKQRQLFEDIVMKPLTTSTSKKDQQTLLSLIASVYQTAHNESTEKGSNSPSIFPSDIKQIIMNKKPPASQKEQKIATESQRAASLLSQYVTSSQLSGKKQEIKLEKPSLNQYILVPMIDGKVVKGANNDNEVRISANEYKSMKHTFDKQSLMSPDAFHRLLWAHLYRQKYLGVNHVTPLHQLLHGM